MMAETMRLEELLSRFTEEVDALEAQHLEGRRVLPAYDGGRLVYDGGRPAVWVSKAPEPTYTAYFSVRLFELWDDLLQDLVNHVEPNAKRCEGPLRLVRRQGPPRPR